MVARLIAQTGPTAGLILPFAEGDEWIIGRDPDEANWVVEDPHASRQHVRCRRTAEGIEVENLSQTNPALLNGMELATPSLLHEGDTIQLGSSLFVYTSEEKISLPDLKQVSDEEPPYDTIFEMPEIPIQEPQVYLEGAERWLLKVVSGPNSGAEVRLNQNHSYLVGTDVASCDIVFNDLSVSRQHARLTITEDERIIIEDLGSRNGVIVDGLPIAEPTQLQGNTVISLGTTSILIVDRESAQETVISAVPSREEIVSVPQPLEVPQSVQAQEAAAVEVQRFSFLRGLPLALLITAAVVMILVIIGLSLLFSSHQVTPRTKNYALDIEQAVGSFPDVRYSFNEANGRLFILGHVSTPVEKSELSYNLRNLPFVGEIDDNVVVDQTIWEETNAILSKNPDWVGVSMFAPSPGKFVLSGYLKTAKQAISLQDYIHLNFPYVDRLENRVVVEEVLIRDLQAQLQSAGLVGVQPLLINGELALNGYVNREDIGRLDKLIDRFSHIQGIRRVKNLTVIVADTGSMVDLKGYQVQGYTQHDGMTVNVQIDGQLIGRGESFNGMQVISITSRSVILEKDGIKYKIDYNQSGPWSPQPSKS